MCAGVGLSGGRGRLLTHVHRANACTLNGECRGAPRSPTRVRVWRCEGASLGRCVAWTVCGRGRPLRIGTWSMPMGPLLHFYQYHLHRPTCGERRVVFAQDTYLVVWKRTTCQHRHSPSRTRHQHMSSTPAPLSLTCTCSSLPRERDLYLYGLWRRARPFSLTAPSASCVGCASRC